jgi:glycosyltransferase involved in cell wall biosynthesis
LIHQRAIGRIAHLLTIPTEIPLAFYVSRKRKENLLQADAIITVSQSLEKKMGQFMPEIKDKITTAYNPLPEVGEHVGPSSKGRRILLYGGGSIYEKGIFHLLKIWRLLVKSYRNLELWAASTSGSYTIRRTVEKYKLTSSVKLLPKVNHEQLMMLTARAHAAVVPSLGSEGLPYTMIEPMAVGRPVFASPVGGIPEVLRNGHGGYFINPCDSSKSAGVLAKIVNLDEIVRQGKYAKEHITRLLTYENTSGRLLNVLAEIA